MFAFLLNGFCFLSQTKKKKKKKRNRTRLRQNTPEQQDETEQEGRRIGGGRRGERQDEGEDVTC